MVKKRVFLATCAVLFAFLLLLPAGAEEATGAAESVEESGFGAIREFRESLPPEVTALLPDGFFGEDPETVASAVQNAADVPKILAYIRDFLGVSLRQALPLLAAVSGILVLSAVLRAVGATSGAGTGRAFSFCSLPHFSTDQNLMM